MHDKVRPSLAKLATKLYELVTGDLPLDSVELGGLMELLKFSCDLSSGLNTSLPASVRRTQLLYLSAE